jgi:glutathione S-transferase
MKVELYHREECPYSAKVRDFIASHQLRSHISYHDVDEEEDSLAKLEKITGDNQVPCLMVDHEPILESTEIVDWLESHEDELFVGEEEE